MVALPLHLSGMKPVLIHNILMVFFLALAGYTAALLAVQCRAETAGAVFTGTAVALLPWFQSHLWHLQLFSGGLMALFFAMRTSQGKSGSILCCYTTRYYPITSSSESPSRSAASIHIGDDRVSSCVNVKEPSPLPR